jgi:AcrR family transcriptional regulator
MPETAVSRRRTPASGTHSGPRSRKGEQTRARLIDAAREVFERDGFLTARVADIAIGAGMSQGSFYHYFDSKEQIFREVAEAQEQRLTAPPDPSAEPTAGTATGNRDTDAPRSVIGAANRRYLERYRDAAGLMGVIEQVSRYDEQVNAARFATMQHFVVRAESSIRRLQSDGLADRGLDATIAADALGAMVARFAELWFVQRYRDYEFEEAVEQLTRLWANALGLADR